MKQMTWVMLAVLLLAPLTGCASFRDEAVPAHTEVLIYDLPYDLTYLKTIESVESVDGWELDETEKARGVIRARNTEFSNLADKDKSTATFLVKRINRSQTSIELAPESQRVLGGATLMKRISEYVGSELA